MAVYQMPRKTSPFKAGMGSGGLVEF